MSKRPDSRTSGKPASAGKASNGKATGKATGRSSGTSSARSRAAGKAVAAADSAAGKKASASKKPAAPTSKKPAVDETLQLAKQAVEFALERKAVEPVVLDVRDLCSYCSYQVVVSGRSDRQVDAIADGISAGMRSLGRRPFGSEGTRAGSWALLDYGDIVVHVFHHPMREHYDLEGLWSDAPRVELEVPADARIEAPMY